MADNRAKQLATLHDYAITGHHTPACVQRQRVHLGQSHASPSWSRGAVGHRFPARGIHGQRVSSGRFEL